jgi:hypothetical protein
MEVALSREDSKRLGSQSVLLTTSCRLKPYHKDGLHNELTFGHCPGVMICKGKAGKHVH